MRRHPVSNYMRLDGFLVLSAYTRLRGCRARVRHDIEAMDDVASDSGGVEVPVRHSGRT